VQTALDAIHASADPTIRTALRLNFAACFVQTVTFDPDRPEDGVRFRMAGLAYDSERSGRTRLVCGPAAQNGALTGPLLTTLSGATVAANVIRVPRHAWEVSVDADAGDALEVLARLRMPWPGGRHLPFQPATVFAALVAFLARYPDFEYFVRAADPATLIDYIQHRDRVRHPKVVVHLKGLRPLTVTFFFAHLRPCSHTFTGL
jgi:hypothetical protein